MRRIGIDRLAAVTPQFFQNEPGSPPSLAGADFFVRPDRRRSAMRSFANAETLCEAKAHRPFVKPKPIDATRARRPIGVTRWCARNSPSPSLRLEAMTKRPPASLCRSRRALVRSSRVGTGTARSAYALGPRVLQRAFPAPFAAPIQQPPLQRALLDNFRDLGAAYATACVTRRRAKRGSARLGSSLARLPSGCTTSGASLQGVMQKHAGGLIAQTPRFASQSPRAAQTFEFVGS